MKPARQWRVLLVEDHPTWQAILEGDISKALGRDRAGSTVKVVSTYEEASKALRKEGPWSLLVSDMGLGGNIREPLGVRLADIARELRVPTLVVSGTGKMTVQHVTRLFTDYKIGGFLAKDTYDASTFAEWVRKLLEGIAAPQPSGAAKRGGGWTPPAARNNKQVFLLHGRNMRAVEAITQFLRTLGLSVWTFQEARDDLGGAPYTGQVIRNGMDKSGAMIVLFTPDERAELRAGYWLKNDRQPDRKRWQARPNVLFEAGMALAMDERRTILAIMGRRTALLSNLDGRSVTRLDNQPAGRNELRKRLKGAGCDVDMATNDWRLVRISGDFERCIPK